MMKPIHIPPFFHEVFGKRSTVIEILLILSFSLVMSVVLLAFTYSEWKELALWKVMLLLLLALDILGGVIANFTHSTNQFYRTRPRARIVFILLHVQPLLLALLLWNHFALCFLIWGYTILSTFIVNALLDHPAQRTIAAVFVSTGFASLLLFYSDLPLLLVFFLFFYLFKVIFSFGVDHYANRK